MVPGTFCFIFLISQARIQVHLLHLLTHFPFTPVNHPSSAQYLVYSHSLSILLLVFPVHPLSPHSILKIQLLSYNFLTPTFSSLVLTSVLAPSSNLLLDILVAQSPIISLC